MHTCAGVQRLFKEYMSSVVLRKPIYSSSASICILSKLYVDCTSLPPLHNWLSLSLCKTGKWLFIYPKSYDPILPRGIKIPRAQIVILEYCLREQLLLLTYKHVIGHLGVFLPYSSENGRK